jgi:hypothetical protein
MKVRRRRVMSSLGASYKRELAAAGEYLIRTKTAKALGLAVPQSFLARVDEVID